MVTSCCLLLQQSIYSISWIKVLNFWLFLWQVLLCVKCLCGCAYIYLIWAVGNWVRKHSVRTAYKIMETSYCLLLQQSIYSISWIKVLNFWLFLWQVLLCIKCLCGCAYIYLVWAVGNWVSAFLLYDLCNFDGVFSSDFRKIQKTWLRWSLCWKMWKIAAGVLYRNIGLNRIR